MAKKKASEHKTGEVMSAEIRGMLNDNIQNGLKSLEAVMDQASGVVEDVFSKAEVASQDMNEAIGDFLAETRKAKKDAINSLRKQANSALK